MRRLIEPIVMPLLRFATRSYVPGPEVGDAMALARHARDEHSLAATFCYWNDGKEEPRVVADRYLCALDAIHAAGMDAILAVKIPALWDRADLAALVVERARDYAIPVVFDSHAPAQTDTTLEVVERVGGQGVGLAIPGRWRRSAGDVERAIALGARVRVVRGQWPDPDEPNTDQRAGYLDIVDRLAGRASFVGVASHNVTITREALRRLKATDTPCEHELVFPLPISPTLTVAAAQQVSSRLYVPFGAAWLPYSVSRAFQDPRIFLWLARDLALGRRTLSVPRPRAGGSSQAAR